MLFNTIVFTIKYNHHRKYVAERLILHCPTLVLVGSVLNLFKVWKIAEQFSDTDKGIAVNSWNALLK